jgi:sulfur dioxygenase
MQRAGELDSNLPVVTVCRSGARSAQAVAHLTKVGFKKIANLSGGMLRWRDGGHSVEGGQD